MHTHRRPYERLLRKLLAYPNRPALIMLHAYSWHKLLPFIGAFYSGHEAELHEFALFYRIPELSLKAAVYPLMVQGRKEGRLHTLCPHGPRWGCSRGYVGCRGCGLCCGDGTTRT
jgi:hypothetical protein